MITNGNSHDVIRALSHAQEMFGEMPVHELIDLTREVILTAEANGLPVDHETQHAHFVFQGC